jgi:uncharacterized protein (UPF0332 family)
VPRCVLAETSRSLEFLEVARRRLATARIVLDDDPATALGLAYYAMLYAARAALSERDVSARTHRGTWYEFRRAFVEPGSFPADLATAAQKVQPEREDADYEAWAPPPEEARRVLEVARAFVAAVEERFA